MTKPDPVRIAGAGLAGLTTAIRLAQQGISTEVFDRNPDSGIAHRSRCDAIENWTTPSNFTCLLDEWGLDAGSNLHPVFQLEIIDFKGECYSVRLERPLCYLVRRGTEQGSLEQGLKNQALDLGIHIHYGETLAREQADVWAVGSQYRGFFLGVGLTFRTSCPDALMIMIDTRIAPKAYAYLLITEGYGTLSVVLTQQFKQARSFLNDTVKLFQRVRPFDMCDVRTTAGLGGLMDAFCQPSVPLITVGEAAGFQDYLWGFGIRHALLSGYLAARAIAEGIDYQQLVAQEIAPLVQSSIINRMFYDWANNRSYRGLIRWFSATTDLSELMRRCYQERSIQSLLWWAARLQYARVLN